MASEKLVFNGIDGDSGNYAVPPMTAEELAALIEGESEPENLADLKHKVDEAQKDFVVKYGVDPTKLDESGWGVIFAHDADPALQEALSELIELRKEQAGELFKIYQGPQGFRRGKDDKKSFLARHDVGFGSVDPNKVPYYLLIVGSPDAIPYRFQSQLDVQFAVGRIHFDKLDDYASYARSVVASEKGPVKLGRQAAFFSVANEDDRATQMSTEHLLMPLHAQLQQEYSDWQLDAYMRDQATKAQLSRLLGGGQTPALLFTGSHGMSFGKDSPRQLPHQGALLCQDWPGPGQWRKPIPQDFYLAGDDLSSNVNLAGLVAFFFACYGAGTPQLDEFAKQANKEREAIAPYPFLAQLPTTMLSRGALAVLGHVERAWGYSFMWPGAGAQTAVFESTLKSLLDGNPIGYATEELNQRYAELSTALTAQIEEIDYGGSVDPYELSGLWTANNDARGYALIGDPAVRLPVAEPGEAVAQRPSIEVSRVDPTKARTAQVAAPSLAASVEPGAEAVVDYGLLDSDAFKQARARLSRSLERFAERLSDALEDLSTLEVKTFVAEDLSQAADDPAQGAQLQAYTRVGLGGDRIVVVPKGEQGIDQTLWNIHAESVSQAEVNRTEMIRIVAQAASGLLDVLKAA